MFCVYSVFVLVCKSERTLYYMLASLHMRAYFKQMNVSISHRCLNEFQNKHNKQTWNQDG